VIISNNQVMAEIKKFIFDKKNRLNFRRFSKFKKKFSEAYEEIHNYTKDFIFKHDSFRYRFLTWFYQYKKEDLICRRKGCNNPVGWVHSKPNYVCSNKCRKLDGENISKNLIKTNQEKYGVNSTAQLKKTKEKFKDTMQKKYGVNYAMQNLDLKNKFNESMQKKYGVSWASLSKEIINNKRKNSFKKYGVPHPSARKESILKLKKTQKKNFIKKYGNPKIGSPTYNQNKIKFLSKDYLQRFLSDEGWVKTEEMMKELGCSMSSCFNILNAYNISYIPKKNGFNPDKPAILYYLYDPQEDLYKIGITNKSIEERFGKTFCSNRAIAILEQTHFENGMDAYLAEQEILESFSYARYENPSWPKEKGGRTEFFKEDILNIKKDNNDNW